MRGWRPALRIARRTARRSLGRTLLIAALVALPVAGATMADIVARSLSSPEREARRSLGTADARVSVTEWSSLSKDWRPGNEGDFAGTGKQDPAKVDLAALLPRGTRIVPDSAASAAVTLEAGQRIVRTYAAAVDPREPLLRHEVHIVEGRAPVRADEVLLSPALADRLHVRIGMTITPRRTAALTVVGLAREPFCLSCERIVAPKDSPLMRGAEGDLTAYLVDLPPGVPAEAVWRPLAAHGVALTPRDVYLHPERYQPPGGGLTSVATLRAAALALLIAGLGLLEVVLLAGTAFAVGARRQTRDLGLVAAGGGNSRHIRRIVLAQGAVLGAIGAAAGVVAGAALALAGGPLWERLVDAELTGWAFGPWEIAGAALIGLLSGLAAAVVPAIGAGRMRPVDALAERFRTSRRARRRSIWVGVALLVAGAVCGLAGDRLIADDFADYTRQLALLPETGQFVSQPAPTRPVALIVGGATLLVVGIVILAPVLLGRLASVGGRLPVAARLAVRDAARHRHRTGPATSAIAVAVAGSVVLAFTVAGASRAREVQNVPALPAYVLAVDPGDSDMAAARAGARAAAAELPGGRVLALHQPMRPLDKGETLPPDTPQVQQREMYPAPVGSNCDNGCLSGPLAMAGDDVVDRLVADGALDAGARRALAAGKIVMFDASYMRRDGRVGIELSGPRPVLVAAHLADRKRAYSSLPSGLVPAAVARARHWETGTSRFLVTFGADATRDDVDAALDAADRLGAVPWDGGPPKQDDGGLMLAIAGIAAFVTLVGVAISVALSAAEGRADLATLAAVGAAPRRRRALAAFQALVIAGIGCAIGVAGGAFVSYTARTTTGAPEFVVPWANLAVTGLVVPLLAVLVAAVFTPSRLPLVRRAT